MLQPLNEEFSREGGGGGGDDPLVSLVSAGSLFEDANAQCDIHDLSMKIR